jgi:hypothetical protein
MQGRKDIHNDTEAEALSSHKDGDSGQLARMH